MRAIILAAGVGRRIGGESGHPPKCLLKFGGQTLLERHLKLLRFFKVCEIVIAVGFKSDLVLNEIIGVGADDYTLTVFNPDYERGSNVTLLAVREAMTRGGDVLLMDADVLYDFRILDRLINSTYANCFLMDRDFEPGDEPVKLCVKDRILVEFRKQVDADYDFCGESVGFFKFSESVAKDLIRVCEYFKSDPEECYEEALRKLMLQSPPGKFWYEDVTGLPWTEIDFPEDVKRAQEKIFPRLKDAPV